MNAPKLLDLPGLEKNVNLSGFSTFGVGGAADFFMTLTDPDLLPLVMAATKAEKLPVFVLGGGSNVLFSDEGFRGLVVRMKLETIEVEGSCLMAGAGTRWPSLLSAAEQAELSGLEAFSGLPGTLGGAIAGNAGCFGTETADVLDSVELFDPEIGTIRWVTPDFFEFRYRWSRLKAQPGMVVTRARLRLCPGPTQGRTAADILALRRTKQPPGKTGGSFFKNPTPDQPAGRLIDECGLKGLKIGGAQISPKHGNFFMNMGGATAADFLALKERAQAAVQERFGLELQPEVLIVPAQPLL